VQGPVGKRKTRDAKLQARNQKRRFLQAAGGQNQQQRHNSGTDRGHCRHPDDGHSPGLLVSQQSSRKAVHDHSVFQRDVSVRTVVKRCAPLVRIERIDAQTINMETNRFSAAGRTGNNNHPRILTVAKVSS
jgi:hypothetical protein